MYDFDRISRIIQIAGYDWSAFWIDDPQRRLRLTSSEVLSPNAYRELIALYLPLGIRPPIRSEITVTALLRMDDLAHELAFRKSPVLDNYTDRMLGLYAADFSVRAYVGVQQQFAAGGDALRIAVITEFEVSRTAEGLPEDWPTDWWQRKLPEMPSLNV